MESNENDEVIHTCTMTHSKNCMAEACHNPLPKTGMHGLDPNRPNQEEQLLGKFASSDCLWTLKDAVFVMPNGDIHCEEDTKGSHSNLDARPKIFDYNQGIKHKSATDSGDVSSFNDSSQSNDSQMDNDKTIGNGLFPLAPKTSPFVIVPFGWKRIIHKQTVIYCSPSNCMLSNSEAVMEYLQKEGTCKCGLECPLLVEKVFNFDPEIASKPWTVNNITCNDLTKLCNHKRKIIAVATFQSSTSLQGTIRNDSLSPWPVSIDTVKKKDIPFKKRSRSRNKPQSSPYDGVLVSQLLAQRDKLGFNQMKKDYLQMTPSPSLTVNTYPVNKTVQKNNSFNMDLQYLQQTQVLQQLQERELNRSTPLPQEAVLDQSSQSQSCNNLVEDNSMDSDPNKNQLYSHKLTHIQPRPSLLPIKYDRICNEQPDPEPTKNIYTNQYSIQLQPQETQQNTNFINSNFAHFQNNNFGVQNPQTLINQQYLTLANRPLQNTSNTILYRPPNSAAIIQTNTQTNMFANPTTSTTTKLGQYNPVESWNDNKAKTIKKQTKPKRGKYNSILDRSSPCPNIDVRQIPPEHNRPLYTNFNSFNSNSSPPSFLEDPSSYLAQQTAILNSSFSRQKNSRFSGNVSQTQINSLPSPTYAKKCHTPVNLLTTSPNPMTSNQTNTFVTVTSPKQSVSEIAVSSPAEVPLPSNLPLPVKGNSTMNHNSMTSVSVSAQVITSPTISTAPQATLSFNTIDGVETQVSYMPNFNSSVNLNQQQMLTVNPGMMVQQIHPSFSQLNSPNAIKSPNIYVQQPAQQQQPLQQQQQANNLSSPIFSNNITYQQNYTQFPRQQMIPQNNVSSITLQQFINQRAAFDFPASNLLSAAARAQLASQGQQQQQQQQQQQNILNNPVQAAFTAQTPMRMQSNIKTVPSNYVAVTQNLFSSPQSNMFANNPQQLQCSPSIMPTTMSNQQTFSVRSNTTMQQALQPAISTTLNTSNVQNIPTSFTPNTTLVTSSLVDSNASNILTRNNMMHKGQSPIEMVQNMISGLKSVTKDLREENLMKPNIVTSATPASNTFAWRMSENTQNQLVNTGTTTLALHSGAILSTGNNCIVSNNCNQPSVNTTLPSISVQNMKTVTQALTHVIPTQVMSPQIVGQPPMMQLVNTYTVTAVQSPILFQKQRNMATQNMLNDKPTQTSQAGSTLTISGSTEELQIQTDTFSDARSTPSLNSARSTPLSTASTPGPQAESPQNSLGKNCGGKKSRERRRKSSNQTVTSMLQLASPNSQQVMVSNIQAPVFHTLAFVPSHKINTQHVSYYPAQNVNQQILTPNMATSIAPGQVNLVQPVNLIANPNQAFIRNTPIQQATLVQNPTFQQVVLPGMQVIKQLPEQTPKLQVFTTGTLPNSVSNSMEIIRLPNQQVKVKTRSIRKTKTSPQTKAALKNQNPNIDAIYNAVVDAANSGMQVVITNNDPNVSPISTSRDLPTNAGAYVSQNINVTQSILPQSTEAHNWALASTTSHVSANALNAISAFTSTVPDPVDLSAAVSAVMNSESFNSPTLATHLCTNSSPQIISTDFIQTCPSPSSVSVISADPALHSIDMATEYVQTSPNIMIEQGSLDSSLERSGILNENVSVKSNSENDNTEEKSYDDDRSYEMKENDTTRSSDSIGSHYSSEQTFENELSQNPDTNSSVTDSQPSAFFLLDMSKSEESLHQENELRKEMFSQQSLESLDDIEIGKRVHEVVRRPMQRILRAKRPRQEVHDLMSPQRTVEDMVYSEENEEEQGDSPELSSESSYPRTFNIGDLVWGQISGFPSWPGKLVTEAEVKGNHLKTEEGKCQ